ncbi:MAG: hypothetical protein AAF662_02965, partial [Pseudomonadota bacterium]
MLKILGRLAGVLLTFVTVLAQAEEGFRDFYAEPGLNPSNLVPSEDTSESIDLFSGNIQRQYVDLTIPGNGGLDINITRFYNVPQAPPSINNPFGYGWTMHFGRISSPNGAQMLCTSGPEVPGNTENNPTIEFPTGGRELLVHSLALGDGTFITASNWKVECVNSANYLEGMIAFAPDGTRYYMTKRAYIQGEGGTPGVPAPHVETFLTERIVDPYNNTLDFTYLEIQNGMQLLTKIESSDGRRVDYRYSDSSGAPVSGSSQNARLTEIESNGQVWKYNLTVAGVSPETGWGAVQNYELDSVERPDGFRWSYEYGSEVNSPQFGRLTKVTTPSGGETSYGYQFIRPYLIEADFRIAAIASKTKSTPGGASGTWTYEFNPGSVEIDSLGLSGGVPDALVDETIVHTPDGIEKAYHIGYWYNVTATGKDVLFYIGTRLQHVFFQGASSVPIKEVTNFRSYRTISEQPFKSGLLTDYSDEEYRVPLFSRVQVETDGVRTVEEFDDFDIYGNPRKTTLARSIVSPTGGEGDRVTFYTYRNDTSRWLIGLPLSWIVREDGVLQRGNGSYTYTDQGKVKKEFKFGIPTDYTYTAQGDLETVRDARGYETTFSDYYRGQPRREEYPDTTSLTREVNATGTIKSITSQRGHKTSFTYDDLNRVTSIDFPIGADVSIVWNQDNKVLTRGNYRETITWDGFGRETFIRRADLSSTTTVDVTKQYDVFGRKTFESSPNSTKGVSWTYDTLGRVKKQINQDSTSIDYTYFDFAIYNPLGGHAVDMEDERGKRSTTRMMYFGHSESHVVEIYSPEGIATRIGRDVFGKVTSVLQGAGNVTTDTIEGFQDTYEYDINHYLESIDRPHDTGLTTFLNDPLGNVRVKRVGGITGVTVSFLYDEMSRLTDVDYDDDLIDVAYTYDEDGNVDTVSNSHTTRDYNYDYNGNLIEEILTTEGNSYVTEFHHNPLDHLARIEYPSGRTVDYEPDALGRPSKASPYVTEVAYHANGAPAQIHYQNGRVSVFTQDDRLRIDTIETAGLSSLDYEYDPAGNIDSIADVLNGVNSRDFEYDDLNRLVSATSGRWGTASYSYDVVNNLVTKADPKNGITFTHTNAGLRISESSNDANARRLRYQYDALGNISSIAEFTFDSDGVPLTQYRDDSFVFNDANELVSVLIKERLEGGGVTSLLGPGSFNARYDGEGHRVRRSRPDNPDEYVDFVHTKKGMLLGEYSPSGPEYGHEYFYLGRQMVASTKLNAPPVFGEPVSNTIVEGSSAIVSAPSAGDTDGEIVSWDWEQISGPGTFEVAADGAINFTALTGDGGSTARFRVTVTDDRGSQTENVVSVEITFANTPPEADAGPDQFGVFGENILLDGSASSDREGPITFEWSGGSGGALLDGQVFAAHTPWDNGPIVSENDTVSETFTLTVTDDTGLTDNAEVTATWYSFRDDADGDGLSDAWEFLHFDSHVGADPDIDSDGDTILNIEEMRRGTNPRVGNSPLKYAVHSGDRQIGLTWQPHIDATFYRVYWSDDPDAPSAGWPLLDEVETPYFLLAGLENESSYGFRVEQFSPAGLIEGSGDLVAEPRRSAFARPVEFPVPLVLWQPGRMAFDSNAAGQKVLAYRTGGGDEYQITVYLYNSETGWSSGEVIDTSENAYKDVDAAISPSGDVIVTWIADTNRFLGGFSPAFSRYRPAGGAFGPRLVVSPDSNQSHGNFEFESVTDVALDGKGRAHMCFIQDANVRQSPSGSVRPMPQSRYSVFEPSVGWLFEPMELDPSEDYGEVLSQFCAVNSDGQVVVAWTRRQYRAPDYNDTSKTLDSWLAFWDPVSGWSIPRTVEGVINGSDDSSGIDHYTAVRGVEVSESGEAVVVWYDETNALKSLTYDFDTQSITLLAGPDWSYATDKSFDDLTEGVPLSVSLNGTWFLSWGQDYVTRAESDAAWSLSAGLPYPSNGAMFGDLAGVLLNGDEVSVPADSGVSPLVLRNNATTDEQDGGWGRSLVDGSVATVHRIPTLVTSNLVGRQTVYWANDTLGIRESTQAIDGPLPVVEYPSEILPFSIVSLDATDSNAAVGGDIDFNWVQLLHPPNHDTPVVLQNSTSAVTTFQAPGVPAQIQLALETSDDSSVTTSRLISIAVVEPTNDGSLTLFVTSPAENEIITVDSVLALEGSSADDEEGDLSGQIVWVSSLDGHLGTGRSLSASALTEGDHTIVATISDADGNAVLETRAVVVRPASDNVPDLEILTPVTGENYGLAATVTLSAMAFDEEDGDIADDIQWASSIDGEIGSGRTLLTSTLTPGVHVVTASVTDLEENTTDSSVLITVHPTDQNPSLRIAYPNFGRSVVRGSTIALVGHATDPEDGDISHTIEWRAYGEVVGVGSIVEVDTSVFSSPIGPTFTATVIDSNGNSRGLNTRINWGALTTTPPSVVIDTPTTGSVAVLGEAVNLSATAFDESGDDISADISWFERGILGFIGNGKSQEVTSATAGAHFFVAQVRDSANDAVYSAVRVDYVTSIDGGPQLALLTPSSGFRGDVGEMLVLSATATDAVENDLSSEIVWSSNIDGQLGTGSPLPVNDLSAGTHTIVAVVTDGAGAATFQTVQISIQEAVDDAPPQLTIDSPSDGTTVTLGGSLSFAGTAMDVPDGDISGGIEWSSNVDGALFTGGSGDYT